MIEYVLCRVVRPQHTHTINTVCDGGTGFTPHECSMLDYDLIPIDQFIEEIVERIQRKE